MSPLTGRSGGRGGTAKLDKGVEGGTSGVAPRRAKSARPGRIMLAAAKPRSAVGTVRTASPWRSVSAREMISAVARMPRRIQVLGGLAIVAVFAVVGYLLLMPQVTHVVSVPASMNGYVRQPAQASQTAQQLKSRILTRAGGAVSNVVAATYEKTASSGTEVVVFIGGNSSSGGDFISGITELRGSFTTSAGSLGGQAACAPSTNGGPAECAWADGDTFGVLVSATLNANGLADEMRLMRSLVERVS